MAKPTIVTRAGKGSALSWTEGDSNLTNLQNATFTIEAGTGGTDVVSDLNGVITLVAGTNVTLSGDNTAKTVTINASGGGGSTASLVTLTADNSTNATNYITFVNAATGDEDIRTDTGLSYNPSTGLLTATGFAGTHTGAHDGTVGATTPNLGTFTGLTARGNGTTASPARLSLPVLDHWSTAWTTNGIGISAPGGFTYRDTTSTGTVNAVYVHTLGGASLARTNTGAFTNAATLYVAPPSAGFQTTITNPALAAFFDGAVRVAQNLNVDGGFSMNGAVGATSPNTGAFTTLSASTSVSFSPSGAITLNPTTAGTINNMSIGATTATTGAFTTLSASTSVSFSPSGAITLNPTTAGTINNMSIGATTASTGRFTTVTSTATTGTAPFTVASTTNVANLNASSLNGATFAAPGAIGGTTASTATFTSINFKNPIEPVFSLGTTGGTIAPDPANGSVQIITLNAALTINAFTNPTAGESLTLIINGGTAYTAITSTMKFAGGTKTLTGTAGCVDILSVFYDGTTYYASLGKGFA